MHKLRKFYYNNKTAIHGIILFIVFAIIILQLANYMVSQKNKEKYNNIANANSTENTTQKENTNTSVTTDKSAVTGGLVSKDELEIVSGIIEKFVSFCNDKNIEQAYNLLSEQCKEENFKDVETFKKLYYEPNFAGNAKKTATIENWFGTTYQVFISNDALSTGKVSEAKKRDYMTIVEQDGEYKLNIHSFIEKEEINKEQTLENVTFKVVSRNIYMDYEEYTIQVQNASNNTVLLDTQKSTKTIYLEDENFVKYYCYTNEIISEFLKINSGGSSQIKLRFVRSYSSSPKDVSLVLSDILLNYNGTVDESSERQQINIPI